MKGPPGADRAVTGSQHQVTYTHHLVGLLGRAEAAAARLADADPDRRREVATLARREAARRSVRLDGSPLDEDTAARVDAGAGPGAGPDAARPGLDREAGTAGVRPLGVRSGWSSALNLDGMATQNVAALEYAGALAAHDAGAAAAASWHDDPLAVLADQHRLLVAGLVAPDVAGRWRRTEQAIHDGAQGRMLHRAPLPDAIPELMAGLARWIVGRSPAVPAAVAAGVVHERVLELLPFEAANGRLARAAARIVRRARGLDPDAVAVPERAHAQDPLGYHAEVGATVRRRGDLGPWLERDTWALVVALEAAVDAVTGRPHPEALPAARAVVDALAPGEGITVPEFAGRTGLGTASALVQLDALGRAGALAPDPGSRGLRWRRVA